MRNQEIFAQSLPLLEEIYLKIWCELSIDLVLLVMAKFEKLTWFEFQIFHHSEYQHVQNRLDTDWSSSIHEFITLTRQK